MRERERAVDIVFPTIVTIKLSLPLQAEMKKKPLGVMPLKCRHTTGRVWPGHVSGVCLVDKEELEADIVRRRPYAEQKFDP